ncbi:acetyl-coenzyme A synthetase N-terminal domain-containing protein, partial [Kitasatospora sp. NPDC001159]
MSSEILANLIGEERRLEPPAALAANATTADHERAASEDRLGFWAEQARRLSWAVEPTETLDWSNP